jgi:RNA polymerase sigma-70 factor (ECF subfamily)
MTVPIIDDDSLQQERIAKDVALATAGDRQAFEALYRVHVNRVFALCVRMTNDRSASEELTQDVFVRAWQKLSLFRGDSAFGTWLHRLAVNVVLNARKTEGRDRRRFGSKDAEPDEEPAELQLVARAETPGLAMDLEQAIRKLPPGARKVFVLHDVEGFKHEEIAEQLSITTGGSKAQLHRARMLLRQALER